MRRLRRGRMGEVSNTRMGGPVGGDVCSESSGGFGPDLARVDGGAGISHDTGEDSVSFRTGSVILSFGQTYTS